MNIGEKIKAARKEKNLTQEELGALLGIQKSAVAKYENGRVVNIKMSTLEKICTVLGIKASELFLETEPTSEEFLTKYPLFKEENDQYLLVSDGSAKTMEEDKYLVITCEDNSMANDRILSGDAVFVKKQFIVDNGDIAAVSIDGEKPIFRRFFYSHKENKLVLSAGNPSIEPLVFLKDEISRVNIIGKAVSFQSKIN